jgi:multicomponent Na+:H+ antiporter subunit B
MSPRTVIMDVFVRLVYPLMLVAAVWILLRGHNEPGGGFIGGMVAVAATAMLAAARGATLAQRRIPLGPLRLAAASVLLSLASGLPALAVGQSYMTHLWATLPLGFTELKISTVLAFDVGVFGAVWGALGGLCAQMIAIDEEPEPSTDSSPAGAPGRSR